MIIATTKLLRRRAFLREERRRIRIAAERLEEIKTNLAKIRQPDWLADRLQLIEKDSTKRVKASYVKINVGGLIFEVSADILQRDSSSLLAGLNPSSPDSSLILPDEGIFYFDRDWYHQYRFKLVSFDPSSGGSSDISFDF